MSAQVQLILDDMGGPIWIGTSSQDEYFVLGHIPGRAKGGNGSDYLKAMTGNAACWEVTATVC